MDWQRIDGWQQPGAGYFVILLAASGENLCEFFADDFEDLLGPVMDQAAENSDDIALVQADGIGPSRELEAINAHWVAIGGLSNPTYDPSVKLH